MTIPGSSSGQTVDDILGFSEDVVDGSGAGPTLAKVCDFVLDVLNIC